MLGYIPLPITVNEGCFEASQIVSANQTVNGLRWFHKFATILMCRHSCVFSSRWLVTEVQRTRMSMPVLASG
uniref:Uncharacterized protein n=1 Tax=Anguilla anguilla TaxID=7936 RepID=A0A0E9RF02_ANGAN